MKKLVVYISSFLLFIGAINVIAYDHFKGETGDASLGKSLYTEFFKISVQGLFIGVAGGIILQEYNRRRQIKIDQRAMKDAKYKSLVDIYLKTKRARWLLRSSLRDEVITEKEYTEQIHNLIEVKAAIEIILHEIHVQEMLLTNEILLLQIPLEKMESYLRDLIIEYYEPGHEVAKLKAFIDRTDSKKEDLFSFHTGYRLHFREALKILNKENKLEHVAAQVFPTN